MTTVADILDVLEALAPCSMKMDWDNVGLLCGSRKKQVEQVLVALDPFEDVCDEAVEWGADVIVTHHPLIFRPVANVTDETGVGRVIERLCSAGISAVNAHTNLDCAPGGVNDELAAVLGLRSVTVLNPSGTDAQGRPWGLLRGGETDEQPLGEFLQTVKRALGCPGLRYVDGGKPVRRVAVGGGSCADEMLEAVAAGCDTFVTADVRYNQFWDAHDLGLNLIDAGHFYTENPVTRVLADALAKAFPDISVKISETHTDCMKYA
ncbi:Nif3-like dinuclear metal center hexameric protein [Faecousia sp.]|jgi:dinuclear metal center protein, YbgI family|uniref:Nif3-like dinuclear metal center hexameric protein n=1 Tax=Faecousia sp. TaxID=2952921 RepID=UPI003AF4670E